MCINLLYTSVRFQDDTRIISPGIVVIWPRSWWRWARRNLSRRVCLPKFLCRMVEWSSICIMYENISVYICILHICIHIYTLYIYIYTIYIYILYIYIYTIYILYYWSSIVDEVYESIHRLFLNTGTTPPQLVEAPRELGTQFGLDRGPKNGCKLKSSNFQLEKHHDSMIGFSRFRNSFRLNIQIQFFSTFSYVFMYKKCEIFIVLVSQVETQSNGRFGVTGGEGEHFQHQRHRQGAMDWWIDGLMDLELHDKSLHVAYHGFRLGFPFLLVLHGRSDAPMLCWIFSGRSSSVSRLLLRA